MTSYNKDWLCPLDTPTVKGIVMAPPPTATRLEILDGNVALLTLDQPGSRANTLGQAVLGELERRVKELAGRTDLTGLILCSGKPGMFIAGADLKELAGARPDAGHGPRHGAAAVSISSPPSRRCRSRPSPPSTAPAWAAARSWRSASTTASPARIPKTEIGLPETKIGLIPGWGGTQRLTRLIGPSLAAEMICAGEAAKADRARQLGIVFDAVPSDRLLDEARRLLQWAKQSGDWREVRRRKKLPVGLSEEQMTFTFAVLRAQVPAKTGGHYPAPLAALDAIAKGCNLPLEDGLKAETEAFVPLVGSPISRNLIAVFFMTQRLQKDPGVGRRHGQAARRGPGRRGRRRHHGRGHRRRPRPPRRAGPAHRQPPRPPWKRASRAVAKSLQGRVEIGRMTIRRRDGGAGPAQFVADAQRPGRPRRGDRGHRRERGGQGEAVRRGRKAVAARRDPGLEHIDDLHYAHGEVGEGAGALRRDALLQPRGPDAAGRGDPRREDRATPRSSRWSPWPSASARRRSWCATVPASWSIASCSRT